MSSLILYGSKARGDAHVGSDIDLIYADNSSEPSQPKNINGVTAHRYPKPWLISQAQRGSLFTYHVAFEGLSLLDGDNFLELLKQSFKLKDSYQQERDLALIVTKVMINSDWRFNQRAIERFIWSVRTAAISHSTNFGPPVFNNVMLEDRCSIDGLSSFLNNRRNASYENCIEIGLKITRKLLSEKYASYSVDDLKSVLLINEEIYKDSLRIIEEEEALANLGIYT